MLISDYQRLVSDYKGFIKQKSKHTIAAYEYTLDDFLEFISTNGTEAITDVEIQKYINQLIEKKNSSSTIRYRFRRLKGFIKYARADADIDLTKVSLPSLHREEKIIPDEKAMQRYFEEVETIMRAKKLKTLLMILPLTGLRISEAIGDRQTGRKGIEPSDIVRRENHYFLKVTGKAGHVRYVPLNDLAKDVLLPYSHEFEDDEPMFDIPASTVKDNLRKIGEKIGARLSPHTMRHYFISKLIEQNVDLKTVQDIVGHVHPSTTLGYAHTTLERKWEAVQRIGKVQ